MSEAELFEQFKPALERFTINEEFAEQIKKAMDDITERHRLANKQKFDDYRKVLETLDREQDEAYVDLKKGVIGDEHYQRIVGKVKENRRYYTTLIEKCSDTIIDS